jgi:glycosyltransferase involved in cell wall biosynthesis
VFWNEETRYASTSYLARLALASGVPVLTSRTADFTDLSGAVFQPEDLVSGVDELFTKDSLRTELASAAQAYCQETSWSRVAEQHLALWRMISSG